MSSQAKLTVRPLPHLDFVLGYPGIPASSQASRNAAHISGNVEVRLGSKGMKARWIRVELRKLENAAGGEHWGELIGRGPIDVWAARAGAGRADRSADDEDGSHWEVLQTADFPFKIAIPEGLPSTCRLDKQIGISYEVVASLCVKTPKGLFRKEETTSVIQSMHPVTIEKHEMHSTWPIYNQPELHSGENGLLRAKLRRERSCYAPGDRIKIKVIVSSNRVDPAKIKSVAFTLKETVTFHGGKAGRASLTSNAAQSGKAASQHVEIITQKAKQVGKKLYKGDSMDFDIECIIPKSHNLMTISTAKHIEVSYTMRVYVDISRAAIVIDHIPMIMTNFPRAQSQEIMRKIGFVDGLSDRDLSLDDDEEQPRLHKMHSVNPGPQSTRTYSGAYGVDQDQGNGINRRDTMMSSISGPGMAGRGVPGQTFSYGSYGAAQRYSDEMAEPPRPAFAGPAGNHDEMDHLSATERAALAHYSTATPRQVLPLNADHRAIGTIPGLGTPPVSPRAYFDSENGRGGGAPQSLLQHQSPSILTEAALSYQQQRDAEEEKERLYQRARLQAERNQRRADERRAQVLHNGGSLPPSTTTSRTNTPSISHGRNAPPARPASAAVLSSAEEEKKRLYERARREAETYQRSYAHGATFPEEESDSSQNHSNIAHTQQSRYSTAPSSHTRHSVQPQQSQQRRDSEMYWLDSPTVDPMEARGIHSLGTQRHSSPQVGASSSSSHGVSTSASMPPRSFLSAEEEKERLYNQAKAQTESHLQQQQQQHQQQQEGSSLGHTATSSRPRESLVSKSSTAATVVPSASSEKAQLARFQAAIDAVERRRLQDEGNTGDSIQSDRRTSATSPPPPRFNSAFAMSSSPSAPALTEKEQMRLYYEAKDRQAEAEAPPASSSSSAMRHSTGYTSSMANPRPTYAVNYQNGGGSSNNNNHGVSYTQPPNMSSPLSQGAFPSHRAAHNGANADGHRVASYDPIPSVANAAPPTLPPLERLSFGNDEEPWRGGTPKPDEGPWAPKFASSNWIEAGSYAERTLASEPAKNDSPPPVPPKTPLLPFWK